MLAGQLSKQTQLATLLADFAGLTGIEAATVEAAGASAAMALRAGTMAVSSGMVDVAMVLGVEKLSEQVPAEVEAALAMSSDTDYEAEQGMTLTAQAAMLAQRYVYEHKVPEHALAGFALTAHANGAHNPNAMFRKAIKPETYAKAGMVSAPLNMFDVAPNADGAAALILTRRELLPPKFSHPLVEITGSSAAYDLHEKLRVYRRTGVQEYVIFLLLEQETVWYRLNEGRYETVAPDESGIIRSQAFPGLYLYSEKFWADDLAGLLEALQTGLNTAEHAAFAESLQ